VKAFVGLLKRELQEHPALFMGPIGVNAFVALSALLLVARAIGSPENLRSLAGYIDMASEQTQEIGRSALITSPMWLVVLVTIAVGYFYFLDCLFSERKERTILFFKSFPVNDTETVLSKLCCGVVILPALSLGAFAVTQIFVLIVISIALAAAGGSPGALWNVGAILSNWAFTFYVLVSCALWYAPFIAFLILVSAWAKRAVFLWSLAPFLLMQAEFLLPGRAIFTPVILGHLRGYPPAAFSFDAINTEIESGFAGLFEGGTLQPLTLANPAGFVSQPGLWVGGVVAALFLAGAIYLRRYRDDS
jgi:ABC-2 type transport system permease protein